MVTSVSIDDETVDRLEELQAEIRLKTGKNVTQQEVLARLVERAIESRSAFVDSFRDTSPSLGEDELAAFNEGLIASGQTTSEADIDETLYG